jgi:hypothetical protein
MPSQSHSKRKPERLPVGARRPRKVTTISVNRAAVMTLWASVVARRLGFAQEEALTMGRAVAGLNAQAKGRKLGIFKPHEEKATRAREKEPGAAFKIDLLRRAVPVQNTPEGIRALAGKRLIDPDSVERYLEDKFGESLKAARSALQKLARAHKPKELAAKAYALYEKFRPAIPTGTKGWGAKGDLDLRRIEKLAARKETS